MDIYSAAPPVVKKTQKIQQYRKNRKTFTTEFKQNLIQ